MYIYTSVFPYPIFIYCFIYIIVYIVYRGFKAFTAAVFQHKQVLFILVYKTPILVYI